MIISDKTIGSLAVILRKLHPTTDCFIDFGDGSWIHSSVSTLRDDPEVAAHADVMVIDKFALRRAGDYGVSITCVATQKVE